MTNYELLNEILQRIESDKKDNVRQFTIGRGEVIHIEAPDNERIVYWVVRNEIQRASIPRIDMHGVIIGYDEGIQPETSPENYEGKIQVRVVSRDSKFGVVLSERSIGKKKYEVGLNQLEVDLLNCSQFIPQIVPRADAIDGFLVSQEGLLQFKSIAAEIEELEKILELQRQDKPGVSDLELKKLINEIKKREKERSLRIEKRTRHIINSAQLRDRPVLDEKQEKIKRSKVLEDQLIISGGPGTGKTTSMIQRINFLISNTVRQYRTDLSHDDMKELQKRDNSWVFFSPSQLLKQYLKNLMANENLNPDDARVKVWETARKQLFRNFGLINTETGLPFQSYKNGNAFYQLQDEKLSILLRSYEVHFVSKKKENHKKIIDALESNSELSSKYSVLIKAIKGDTTHSEIKEYFGYFSNLKNLHATEVQKICDEANKILDKLSVECYISLNNSDLLSDIRKLHIEKEQTETTETEDYEEDIDPQDDDDIERKIVRFIKSRLRTKLLSMTDKNTRVSSKNTEITESLFQKIESKYEKEISHGLVINKYLRKIVDGLEKNILSDIPRMYKSFRKEILPSLDILTENGKKVLDDILGQKNVKVHKDEMDLLLCILFKVLHSLHKFDKKLIETSNHIYIEQFRLNSKYVVAIDEATDFSILELSAMTYLSHPKYSCVTLCGDLMQRLEKSGIKSWEEYLKVFQKASLEELNRSYRQTEYLLDMAKDIYSNNTSENLDLTPEYQMNENDPKPLMFINKDDQKRLEWMADRILDINRLNKNRLPSIAIFVKDDDLVSILENGLNSFESILDNDIQIEKCPDGKVLGESSSVRIFNIKYIKGLEFEAVFFWDIDDFSIEEEDLLDRLLYVGISRASFFLGVTVKNDLPRKIKYLEKHFAHNGSWR